MKLAVRPRTIAGTLSALFVLSVILTVAPTARANTASLSLSPGSGNVQQGGVLSVGVYVNAARPVNAVEANLEYPPSSLDFVSIESSSAFNVPAAGSGGGGSVHIERGALPPVSGRQLVATVRFKAKVSSGTVTINFASSSKVVTADDHSNILSGLSGGSYSFKSSTLDAPTPNPGKKEPNKIPEGRLDGAKLQACKAREQRIKKTMARISDRGQKQFNLYSTIYERTKAVYEKKGKALKDYNARVADVNATRNASQLALSAVRSSSTAFKCDGDNPKAVIIGYKDKVGVAIDALDLYRTSVKYLALEVKKIGQTEPSLSGGGQ